MIKRDDGTIEYEVGDVVLDADNDKGWVVGVDDDSKSAWVKWSFDMDRAYCSTFDQLTPADPPAEQDGLYEIDEAIEDVEAGRTRTIDPDVGFVKEPSEPPKRTVKQEWEYAMECAGIAAKHTTPDDLAERVFVALCANSGWSGTALRILAKHALKAAKAFRDAQQAQGGGE